MLRGGELAHVDTDLGDDHLGRHFPHPGDGHQRIPGVNERGHHLIDLGVETGQSPIEVIEWARCWPSITA
jgi:hypothetical protein